jgi:hypothetical protein
MRIFSQGRADTYQARMKRARADAYSRGFLEANLFKLAVDKDFEPAQARDWMNAVIDDARAELEGQHALEREIEVWDVLPDRVYGRDRAELTAS